MNRTAKPARRAAPDAAPKAPLSGAERAELQRQGAKAAARGEPNDSNPFSQARNKPPATGDSADRWSQRNDAWEEGHEAQSTARRDAEPPAPQRDKDEHD